MLFEQAELSLDDRPNELGGIALGEELLRPTRIYVPEILPLLHRFHIKGMAHITGGGLPGNLSRILPEGLQAVIDASSWEIPPVFGLIEKLGPVARGEMYRTFNMGIGFALVVPPEEAGKLIKVLEERSSPPTVSTPALLPWGRKEIRIHGSELVNLVPGTELTNWL